MDGMGKFDSHEYELHEVVGWHVICLMFFSPVLTTGFVADLMLGLTWWEEIDLSHGCGHLAGNLKEMSEENRIIYTNVM